MIEPNSLRACAKLCKSRSTVDLGWTRQSLFEAADEIERLQKAMSALAHALKPFLPTEE